MAHQGRMTGKTPGGWRMPSVGLLWEMESLCERGEGGENRGIAGRAEQEAFDLRAGILHVAGVCALLRRNIPAIQGNHCRVYGKRFGSRAG